MMDTADTTRRRDETDRLSRKIDYLQDRIDALKDSMIASRLSTQKEISKLTFFWVITGYIGGLALLALGVHCLGAHP